MPLSYTFTAAVWRHDGPAAWHFVTLPADLADELRARTAGAGRPFGTVPVRVTVGATTWSTSLFADTARGSYVLPLKAAVRRRLGVGDGDEVDVMLSVAAGGPG